MVERTFIPVANSLVDEDLLEPLFPEAGLGPHCGKLGSEKE